MVIYKNQSKSLHRKCWLNLTFNILSSIKTTGWPLGLPGIEQSCQIQVGSIVFDSSLITFLSLNHLPKVSTNPLVTSNHDGCISDWCIHSTFIFYHTKSSIHGSVNIPLSWNPMALILFHQFLSHTCSINTIPYRTIHGTNGIFTYIGIFSVRQASTIWHVLLPLCCSYHAFNGEIPKTPNSGIPHCSHSTHIRIPWSMENGMESLREGEKLHFVHLICFIPKISNFINARKLQRYISTPPKINTAPKNRSSQKEASIPTIHFQVLCDKFQGDKSKQHQQLPNQYPVYTDILFAQTLPGKWMVSRCLSYWPSLSIQSYG